MPKKPCTSPPGIEWRPSGANGALFAYLAGRPLAQVIRCDGAWVLWVGGDRHPVVDATEGRRLGAQILRDWLTRAAQAAGMLPATRNPRGTP